MELLSIAFMLSKLTVVLGFAEKRSFCFFLHDNNHNSRNSPATSKFDFPKMFSRDFGALVFRSTRTHEHSKINLLSPAKLNLFGLSAHWNTRARGGGGVGGSFSLPPPTFFKIIKSYWDKAFSTPPSPHTHTHTLWILVSPPPPPPTHNPHNPQPHFQSSSSVSEHVASFSFHFACQASKIFV